MRARRRDLHERAPELGRLLADAQEALGGLATARTGVEITARAGVVREKMYALGIRACDLGDDAHRLAFLAEHGEVPW